MEQPNNEQDQKSGKPKKKFGVGSLFSLHLKDEVAPLKESGRMIVRMIALIFASYRLFPRNHPAFNDIKDPLTLRQVIGIAYSNLQFTRRGIPQIAVFFAIVGCLVLFVLTMLTMLLSLFVSSAHAQSMFKAPTDPKEDWGLRWIDYLFLGQSLGADSTGNRIASDPAIQVALGAALNYYSLAILVLAGFLLLYHLVFMVAETAHTGKVMGRANQIWAPIRLVFAIGMLVPIAAGGGGGTETSAVTGYNTAQYIAIQVGKWGSGLAGNVWKTFLTALDSNKMAGICPSDDDAALPTPSCIKVTAQSLDTVTTLMAMDACTKIINKYAKESHATTGFSSDNWDALGGEDVVIVETTWGGIRPFSGREWDKHFEPGIKYGMDLVTDRKALSSSLREYSYKDLCGSYSIPLARGLYAGVYETQRDAFYKLTKYVDTAVGEVYDRGSLVNSGIRAGGGYQDARKKAYVDAIQRLALDFQGVFKRGAEEEIGLVDEHLAGNPAYNMGPKGRYQVTGWLSAAAWFPQITAIVGARSAALEGSLPHTTMPTLVEGGSTGFTVIGGNGTAAHSLDAASADYTRFMSVLRDAAEQVGVNANKLTSASSEMKEFASGDISTERVTGWFSGSILAGVLKTVDYIMSLVGLTEPDGALAVRFGKGMNPLLEISALGHKFIRVGASAVEIGATAIMADKILDAVTSKIPGLGKLASALLKAVGSAAGFIGTCLLVVAPIFFMVGVMLGFIVPLYPFYRFFFGAVKWIMTLFEAVIMAPLFALAHVNPYGEGLAGQYGKYGYSVAMQLLLRPVLMVFGLIAGYLLFTATLHFLNDAFYFATSATLAQDSIISVLAKLVYSIIYAALVIILANQCFRTIGLFPDVALSWLGMQGIKEEQIGDHQMLAAAGGWLARGGMDGLSKAVRGGAGALGTGIGKMIPDKTSGAGVSRGVGGPMGTAYALPKSTQTPSPSASPAGGGYFSNFGNMGGTPGNLYAGGTGAYGQGNTNVSGTQASTATAQTTSQSPPASGYDSGLAGRLAQMGDIGDNHTASSGDAQTPDPDKSSAKDQDKSLLGQIKDKPPESGGDGGTFV